MKKRIFMGMGMALAAGVILIFAGRLPAAAQDRAIIRTKSNHDAQTLLNRIQAGANHALVIGINQYQHHPNLKTAVNDAEALAAVLKADYFFPEANIKLLKNQEATKERIMQAFDDLIMLTVKPGDNVFIYYAGHGYYDEIQNTGYWVTTEATTSRSTFLENHIILNYIKALDRKKVKHVFLVSDSCFSGSFLQAHRSVETDIDDRYFQEFYQKPSRNVLTSGGIEYVSDEGKDGHSIFAYYFLKTLRENPYPYISVKQLGVQIEELVTRNSRQKPISSFLQGVGDETGQFFFIAKKRPEEKPRDFPEIPALPSGTTVSLDDLESAATERKKRQTAWDAWQTERSKDYQKVKTMDSDDKFTPAEKALAWSRFAAAVSQDNPFIAQDDEMRNYSDSRLKHWNEKATAQPPKPPATASASTSGANETARDGRFIKYNDGTVVDTKTGLMWAAKDNGSFLNWDNADKYCKQLTLGGHKDWRLPTIDELRSLYDEKRRSPNPPTGGCSGNYRVVTDLIHITCCCPWSSEVTGSSAAIFHFPTGIRYTAPRSNDLSKRALAVRGGK